MIELRTPQEKKALLPLFPAGENPLLLSALLGTGGRAFASGASAFVWARDFVFLAGPADGALFSQAAALLPPGFVTFSGPDAWLDAAMAWGAKEEMTRYDLMTPAAFDRPRLLSLARPPQGYDLLLGDGEIYARCREEAWSRDLVSAFPDADSFQRSSLLACAVEAGKPVSGCGVYARWGAGVEIEIDTHPLRRGQGLATACGALFLLNCMDRGLRPHWDAMNETSLRIAQTLGFGPARPYRAVCRR